MIINNSINKVIHTQRNNKNRPYSACNVTSFVNALKYCDITYEYPKDKQPEDFFMEIMDSPQAWKMMYEKYGKGCVANPWNFSDLLVWFCNNILVGSPVCEIKYINAKGIKDHLLQGNVCTVSGKFTNSGHFVCIVGCEIDDDNNIKKFIIDDTNGNYHTKYRDYNGDNIDFPIDDFFNIIWPIGKKVKKAQFFYRE